MFFSDAITASTAFLASSMVQTQAFPHSREHVREGSYRIKSLPDSVSIGRNSQFWIPLYPTALLFHHSEPFCRLVLRLEQHNGSEDTEPRSRRNLYAEKVILPDGYMRSNVDVSALLRLNEPLKHATLVRTIDLPSRITCETLLRKTTWKL